jgi:hypothetical protein
MNTTIVVFTQNGRMLNCCVDPKTDFHFFFPRTETLFFQSFFSTAFWTMISGNQYVSRWTRMKETWSISGIKSAEHLGPCIYHAFCGVADDDRVVTPGRQLSLMHDLYLDTVDSISRLINSCV